MSASSVPCRWWLLSLAAFVACAGSGCTTVLSTASLRDMVLGIEDRVDDDTITASPSAEASREDEGDTADAERRAAAIDEAISRLSKVGVMDDAARTTLVATLQRTDQEDWPVVVDAFAESLAETPEVHVVAKADLDTASIPAESPPETVAPDPTEPPEPEPPAPPVNTVAAPPPAAPAPAVEPAVAVSAAPEPPPEPSPAAEPPAPEPPSTPVLAIQNASFASRVQAWGVLDRFAADRFRPGQEVIVYFELENLSAGESTVGHTTCIDSCLRLLTNEGDTVHAWTFEPIAETCRARRHDYFARYMVRIPAEAKPGRHTIELAVTDTLSGQKAVATLAFEIAAP